MQVSTDGTLKYITSRSFKSKKGNDLYLVEMYDNQEKRNVSFFAEGKVFSKLLSCDFGNEFQCVFNVSPRGDGYGLFLVDLVG